MIDREKLKTNYIVNLDATSTLKELPDKTLDRCITSPPYYGLRDYKAEGQIEREESPEEHLNRLAEVFREIKKVLKKEGTLWIVIGNSYAGTRNKGEYKNPKNIEGRSGQKGPIAEKLSGYEAKGLMRILWQLALELREEGQYLRDDIIWYKEDAMSKFCRDKPSRSYKHIFLLSKIRKYFCNFDATKEPIKEISKNRYVRARGKNNKYLQEGTGTKRQNTNEVREYKEYIGDNIPKFRNNRDI